MATSNVSPFSSKVAAELEAREESYTLIKKNQFLARPILHLKKAPYIAVNPGGSHLKMENRDWISENELPVASIAIITPDSQIVDGLSEAPIGALVSIGSPLSNLSARILDGHAKTLKRIRRPVFGTYLTEFYTSNRSVVSYIGGEKVLEPYREIINESNLKRSLIFAPRLDKDGIPQEDALTIKVLRSRSNAPAFLRIEGWGPAGTVHGFRLLLENKKILRELSRRASREGSFEAVFVVEGVHAEAGIHGRMYMAARGPLHLVAYKPIREPEESIECIRRALETSAPLITKREKTVFYLAEYKCSQLALDYRIDYNPGSKYAATPVVPPRKEYLENEGKVPAIETVLSEELKKTGDEFREKIASHKISDAEKIDIFIQGVSVARDVFEARIVKGITLEEFYIQKAQEALKREGVVFENQPKPKEPLTPPDLSEIPLWQGRKKDGMPLEFIKTHYGQWLSAFGAEENSVFQDQIRAYDPKLMQGLRSQLHEEGRRRRVAEFVKPRAARTERELEQFDIDTLKQARRAQDLLRRQQAKNG